MPPGSLDSRSLQRGLWLLIAEKPCDLRHTVGLRQGTGEHELQVSA